MDFKKFTKKSNVDMHATDAQGWTAIHHLVAPLDYGSYDNVEMLKILYDNHTNIWEKDHAGLTALDYALIRGVTKLAKAIQKLMRKNIKDWVSQVLFYLNMSIVYCLLLKKVFDRGTVIKT